MKARLDILSKKDEILLYISYNYSKTEIARKLNCKIDTLNKYLDKLNIKYQGNQGARGRKHDSKRKPALEFIYCNTTNSAKRIRLIEDGIKENKCECCGLDEWMFKPIPLELHHIDFNHYNNDINNLQILCANCHM